MTHTLTDISPIEHLFVIAKNRLIRIIENLPYVCAASAPFNEKFEDIIANSTIRCPQQDESWIVNNANEAIRNVHLFGDNHISHDLIDQYVNIIRDIVHISIVDTTTNDDINKLIKTLSALFVESSELTNDVINNVYSEMIKYITTKGRNGKIENVRHHVKKHYVDKLNEQLIKLKIFVPLFRLVKIRFALKGNKNESASLLYHHIRACKRITYSLYDFSEFFNLFVGEETIMYVRKELLEQGSDLFELIENKMTNYDDFMSKEDYNERYPENVDEEGDEHNDVNNEEHNEESNEKKDEEHKCEDNDEKKED